MTPTDWTRWDESAAQCLVAGRITYQHEFGNDHFTNSRFYQAVNLVTNEPSLSCQIQEK
jgi:hypothetical protein